MTKVSGSYESVVRGVSEQNAQSRRSGQHEAQVNMISDPVRGLARRHGSIMQDEIIVGQGDPAPYLAQTAKSRVVPFYVADVEYDAILRTNSAPDDAIGRTTLIQCFNKQSRKFIPVQIADSTLISQLVSGGVSAATNVGRFLYVAGHTVVPGLMETPKWGNSSNTGKLVGWVRGGAYSRKFVVRLIRAGGAVVTGEYETKSSSYPELLDTSDITVGEEPEDMNLYTKLINDRTNDYNSRVTAYIGEAAKDITPANIATKLVESLIANGATSAEVYADGGYVVVTNGYTEIEISDSGDDSLVRPVGNTIRNLDLVSSRHFVGKVVKVEPEKNVGDPIYLEAYAKDAAATGWAEVVWRESAGYLMTPLAAFAFGTVHNGTLYLAGSAAELSSMTGLDVPTFVPNKVGDGGSAPRPEFLTKRIDYLGVFQDRLVVGSGGTLMFSRSGDYLNWFRKSVLSIHDDDPWEGYALGAEDDVIRYSALYDRSLLLYGERFQYIVSGRQAFTPQTANISVASAYEDAVDASPKAAGNFVFYCKYSGAPGKEVSSLHQVQPGVVADVSDSYLASQQLDTYLKGVPVELLTMQAPNMVLLRTSDDRNKVFTYSYLDNPNSSERLFDSWSHWTWRPEVGSLAGMGEHKGDILMYTIRSGKRPDGVNCVWYAAEKFVRDTDLSDFPYLDSLRPLTSFLSPAGSTSLWSGADTGSAEVAVERGVSQQFLGSPVSKLDTFLGYYPSLIGNCWVGYDYDAYVIPTNPFMRDRNNQVLLGGRLTLGKIRVSVTDTGGMSCDVTTRNITRNTLAFSGRILGSLDNLVGVQPIVTTTLTATIGGEVQECSYRLSATKWLPFTINSIGWQGQSFFNTRRV